MWVCPLESNQDLFTHPGCCSKRRRYTIVSSLLWETMTKRKNLASAANIHVKTSTLDNKGRCPKRQKSSRAPSAAIMENNGNRLKSRQYKLKWLKDTKAFKCFGCQSAIRIPGEIPEPPSDVIASMNEYHSFMKDGTLKVYFRPTHYYLHRPILPSQTLKEGCFKKRTSATFKMNFRFEETLTLISSPERPL